MRTATALVGVCPCTAVSCSSETGKERETGDSLAVVTGTIIDSGDARVCARMEILKTEGQSVRLFSQPVAEGFSVDIKRPEVPESAGWQTLAAADLSALGIECADGGRRHKRKE